MGTRLCQPSIAGVTTATANTTRGGWTVGVGGKYAFTNWLTGFVEWDYDGFERDNPSGLVCTPTRCRVFVGNNLDITTNINVAKAGLNLKFGPGGFAFGY